MKLYNVSILLTERNRVLDFTVLATDNIDAENAVDRFISMENAAKISKEFWTKYVISKHKTVEIEHGRWVFETIFIDSRK